MPVGDLGPSVVSRGHVGVCSKVCRVLRLSWSHVGIGLHVGVLTNPHGGIGPHEGSVDKCDLVRVSDVGGGVHSRGMCFTFSA